MLEVGNVTIQSHPMEVCHVKEMEQSKDIVMTDLVQSVKAILHSYVKNKQLFKSDFI